MNKEEKKYLIDQIHALLAVVEKEFLQEEKPFVDIFKEICKSGISFCFHVTTDRLIEVYLYDREWNKIWSEISYDYNEIMRKFLKAILKFYPDSEFAIKLTNHAYFNYLFGEEEE